MKSQIFYHVYVSSAVSQMSKEQLFDLMKQSRVNNAKLGITGILLHKDGDFMQMIEGPEEAVQSLLMKIYSDPRHRGVLELIEGYTDERQFSEWAMGLKELDSAETKADPGYSEFLNTPLTSVEFRLNPSRCQRLLLIFKESRS